MFRGGKGGAGGANVDARKACRTGGREAGGRAGACSERDGDQEGPSMTARWTSNASDASSRVDAREVKEAGAWWNE